MNSSAPSSAYVAPPLGAYSSSYGSYPTLASYSASNAYHAAAPSYLTHAAYGAPSFHQYGTAIPLAYNAPFVDSSAITSCQCPYPVNTCGSSSYDNTPKHAYRDSRSGIDDETEQPRAVISNKELEDEISNARTAYTAPFPIPYQHTSHYSAPPQVQCPSNLLINCNPSVANVPCSVPPSYSSVSHY